MKKKPKNTYWNNIKTAFLTLTTGLKISIRHFFYAYKKRPPISIQKNNYFQYDQGVFTLQYPYEKLPVPDNGRYKLHNEIDDCIVCDKCAKVCPVNCIEIEPIKATSEIGKTSNGTTKRIYAAKFNIDMAKCCFCGLCTTVCPTECLTMTHEYDFSTYDIKAHNFSFSNMTQNEAEQKRKELALFLQQKEKAQAPKKETASKTTKPKIFIPQIKNKKKSSPDSDEKKS